MFYILPISITEMLGDFLDCVSFGFDYGGNAFMEAEIAGALKMIILLCSGLEVNGIFVDGKEVCCYE